MLIAILFGWNDGMLLSNGRSSHDTLPVNLKRGRVRVLSNGSASSTKSELIRVTLGPMIFCSSEQETTLKPNLNSSML